MERKSTKSPPVSRRARQAAATRQEILDAALALFARQGYAATTIAEVAHAAGVSPQTIYDSVGAKAALLAALNDGLDARAGVTDLVAPVAHLEDPVELVRIAARVTRRVVEASHGVLRALLDAASSDPALASLLTEGRRRHLAGTGAIARRLDALGRLAVPLEEAEVTLAALTDHRFLLDLHEGYGWSFDRVESWALASLCTLLLRPSAPSAEPTRR